MTVKANRIHYSGIVYHNYVITNDDKPRFDFYFAVEDDDKNKYDIRESDIEGTLIDNKLEGEVKLYYYNPRTIKAILNFKNGELHGEQTFFYPNGHIKETIYCENGLNDGAYTLYYETGQIKEKGIYKKDKKDGEVTRYFETGQIESEQHYKLGKLDGVYKRWDKSGKLKEIKMYDNNKTANDFTIVVDDKIFTTEEFIKAYNTDEKIKKSFVKYFKSLSEAEKFIEKGKNLKEVTKQLNDNSTEKYTVDSDGKKHGLYEKFYPNGQKAIECMYYHGEYYGPYKKYNEDGLIIEDGHYVNDSIGLKRTYYSNGVIEEERHYINNYDYTFVKYYPSGIKMAEGHMISDYRDPSKRFEYIFGNYNIINVGIYREWDESGKLIKIDFYNDPNNTNVSVEPVFVVNNKIYTTDEYIEAYNTGSKEFKNAEVKGFKTLSDAEDYLKTIENERVEVNKENEKLIEVSKNQSDNTKQTVFVVDNTIFTVDEYVQAYIAGSDEFRRKEVRSFESIDDAKKYISNQKHGKSKEKSKEIDR